MRYSNTINDVIKTKLCISCGACFKTPAQGEIFSLDLDGLPLPHFIKNSSKNFIKYCPGKGYDIVDMGRAMYGNDSDYDIELGFYKSFSAACSTDEDITKNASSGGAITAVLDYLFFTDQIQGAVVTKFVYDTMGPVPKTFIARNREELLEAQGSKYCPVPALEILDEVREFEGNLAWVGTPCQIAALRLFQADESILKDKIKFTLANFCGGFRDFREARKLFSICDVEPKDIVDFRYRGDGQPGFLRIETRQGVVKKLQYPDYARMTGYTKLKRCRLCVDAMGELADFSFGDAWLPRFIESGKAWSIVMVRNTSAEAVINHMAEQKLLITEHISKKELKKSQYDNLNSKKRRQASRQRLFKLIGQTVPEFDGGIIDTQTSILTEVKVSLKYAVYRTAEKMGVYPILAKALKRWR
ncbi:MAG: Coenzyme F420 hydrogenase/dehydrogenase, beta subunit C-terminal domain [Desulfamplus sp.]|nr:Coenzyme F420 hydrogenase/dehydrogenase, beta subunit C-terminal domain [Desulfamplus sp.]